MDEKEAGNIEPAGKKQENEGRKNDTENGIEPLQSGEKQAERKSEEDAREKLDLRPDETPATPKDPKANDSEKPGEGGSVSDEQLKEINALLVMQRLGKEHKSGGRRAGCFNCLLGFIVLALIMSFFFAGWFLNFVNSNFMSDYSSSLEPVKLTPKQKEDLDRKLAGYREALDEVNKTGNPTEFRMKLAGNQANALIEQADERIHNLPEKDLSVYRIYPDGDRTRVIISTPMNKKFINTVMVGSPYVSNGTFEMRLASIQVGKIQKSAFMRERTFARINRDLRTVSSKLTLPLAIKGMTVSGDTVELVLTLKPQGK